MMFSNPMVKKGIIIVAIILFAAISLFFVENFI